MKDIDSLSSGAGFSLSFPSRCPVLGVGRILAGLKLPGNAVIVVAAELCCLYLVLCVYL